MLRQDVYEILANTPSVRRATRWWLIYRHRLYKGTFHQRRIRAKLDDAQMAARVDADVLMEEHGYKALWLQDSRLAGLRYAPDWSSDGWSYRIRRTQCERRSNYWKVKAPERARYWHIRYVALEHLRAPWPIPPAWIRQAGRWLDAPLQEQRRIEAATHQERERLEFKQTRRAPWRKVRAEAEERRI